MASSKRRVGFWFLFLLVVVSLAAYVAIFVMPRHITESLAEQVAQLRIKSREYRQRGDEVTALKLAQLALLIEPVRDDSEQRFEELAQVALIIEGRSVYADHQRAEDIATEEFRALGEPALSQLVVVLEAQPLDSGVSCVGLRVLGNLSRRRAQSVLQSILSRGTNDILTREAVIQVLWQERRELVGAIIDLAWKWRGWGRQYPIYTLRRFKERKAAAVAIAALEDKSPAVRRHAVMAIRDLAGGEAIAPLRALLKRENDPLVRTLAETTIAAISRRLPLLEGATRSSGRGSTLPIQE